MGKVSSSYEAITRGVSEQVPQDRRPGQHFAQDNFISDPVRGLARRHGSIKQDERIIANLTDPLWDSVVADTARHKEFTFFVNGAEYVMLYRSATEANASVHDLSFAWCLNKDTRKFVPLVYSAGDPLIEELKTGGVAACVNVGKYVYLAGNNIIPKWTPTDRYGSADNKSKLVAWVRGGAYSRTFEVVLTRADGTKLTASYKTKSSQYPEILDTSDIPANIPDPANPGSTVANPDYQKLVNDRTNIYNSNVTKWIGEAAADITPENIAVKLRDSLALQGVTAGLEGSTITINNASFTEITSDDGGDGSLMRAVGNQVSALDLVSTVHWVGKVVKIRPKKQSGEDAFYLRAVAQDGSATGFAEVRWIEAAGYEMKPVEVFVMGTVVNETLYLASSAERLAAIAGGVHPDFKANVVGDDLSCPIPFFFGKGIDYLGMFQDRLVIGSGATLFFSRPGDYFNWFRVSVLTVDDRDPIEMYALGSEDDTIKTSTTYDRNILLFGKRKQYTVNGRQPLTPKSASIVILSAHEDAVDAEPQNSGNFVFYGKLRNGISSVHQIQMGVLADSPESYNISQQLDRYLKGRAVQILALTSPNQVFLRTEADRYGLFTYAYLDNASGAERVFDAWSRWTWNEALGPCVGITRHDGDILSFMVRRGKDRTGADKLWIACDRFVMDTGLSPYPYLDSLRPATEVQSPTEHTWLSNQTVGVDDDGAMVFRGGHVFQFLGATFDRLSDFLDQYGTGSVSDMWAGIQYRSCVTPTNPYVRDQKDKAIVNGRLTLGRVTISIADSGGLTVDVETANGTIRTKDFNGRLLGRATNLIGRQPIVSTAVSATIGKEVRECKYTVSAKGWLPLTLTAIEWVGQMFNNARRV